MKIFETFKCSGQNLSNSLCQLWNCNSVALQILRNYSFSWQIIPLSILTLFRIGFFGAAHGWGGAFWSPLPKIPHTYPTMMKLGTIISYLRKIHKMYKPRDISLEFCWHQHFFSRNQQILLHQEYIYRSEFDR